MKITARNVSIFIDESGTLPDPKDKVIVLAAVSTENINKIDTLIKQIKKRGRYRKITGELKFYTAGEKTKTLFFKRITELEFAIFILVVEKKGRKIKDTPQHFAILCWLLLNDVFSFYSKVETIFLDRHFSRDEDVLKFNQILHKLLVKTLRVLHVDSKKDRRINISDMIAGAVLAKESGKDNRYYELIKRKVVSYKKLNWIEVKRKLFL